jgi:aminoglycoside phosphotransferase (APT) family kinase protein
LSGTTGTEEEAVIAALRGLGLIQPGETVSLRPLPGGVSSDIHLAEAGGRRFCVKRALPRLKVAALWEAPLSRNSAEAAWFRTVAAWMPGRVPQVLGEDESLGLFAMTYLPADEYPVWKAKLMAGEVDVPFAAEVGRSLAEIHRRSAGDPGLRASFRNDVTFEAIRLEPYLRATALGHPDLAATLEGLADRTLCTRLALVHGDVSPKNILCGPEGPVFLDAECAWFGDPSFDLAFCLNHLLLKGAWRLDLRPRYVDAFRALVASYLEGVAWEPASELEMRAARLLPALWLARIDGKSPVEYLGEEKQRSTVRDAARGLLMRPADRLDEIAAYWESF